VQFETLTECTLVDLVRKAGLHQRAPLQLTSVTILTPGPAAGSVIRRALDLNLTVHYRPVQLSPLFDDSAEQRTTLIQVDLRSDARPLPPALLGAVAELPVTLVARPAGDEGKLLIQGRLGSPLSDERLARLVDGGTWVLADAAFGCWRLEGLAQAQPGAALVSIGRDHELVDQRYACSHTEITPTPLRLIPVRGSGQRVDAMLLDNGDLANLALMMEGHPLADMAQIIRGHDQHLVAAPGGLLESLPAGEPLTCVGPHLLYLPLGYRLAPRLPPTARMKLFSPDSDHAIVVHPRGAWRFTIADAIPLWHLWADLQPDIADQLPRSMINGLSAMEPQPDMPQRRRKAWQPETARQATDSWRAEAWALERDGDYARAAALYRRNHEPSRAANLYERAARMERPDQEELS
jgi:hypothetical protein